MRRTQDPGVELFSSKVSETAHFILRLVPVPGKPWTLCLGGRERCDPDYVVRRRKFGYTVLEFVAEGRGEVVLDGRRFPLEPGSLFAYEPKTDCEIHTDPELRLVKYFLCLGGPEAARALKRCGQPPGSAPSRVLTADLHPLFQQLVREGGARTSLSAQICEALLRVVLLKLEQLRQRPARKLTSGYTTFQKLVGRIDAEPQKLRNLARLALACGTTPVHACKLFKRHLGMSPFRYLMQRKLEYAAELLARQDLRIKEVAAEVGFADPYHFSRRFKAFYGASPAHFRQKFQSSA